MMMNETESKCPFSDNVDRRKSARIAEENTWPDEGAHWIKQPTIARKILRSKNAFQAGAGAEHVKVDNPEHTSVFFLDGEAHAKKRQKTQRFLSPKAVAGQHYVVMEKVTHQLLGQFRKEGTAKLEDMSFDLAIEVVGEILGLTNSEQMARAKRIQRVLHASMSKAVPGIPGLILKAKQMLFTLHFFYKDIKPAMEARKNNRKDDAISFYLDEGYSNKSIIIECLTYGTAGMLTTREFIIMAAWYLFEDEALRERFLAGDMKTQLGILMEILRLEPVAAMIHRRVDEEVEGVEAQPIAAGERYGIDIRATNINEELVGECPFAVDPERSKKARDSGRFLTFGDGPHTCPGWQVALHEARIFLEELFKIPGVKLVNEPEISWNNQLKSYELRNAVLTCDKTA